MKLDFSKKDGLFALKDIDYEMMQLIINGIECERSRIVDKISHLTTYLFKDYPDYQKEEFKVQIEYLKEKNESLTETIKALQTYVTNVPI